MGEKSLKKWMEGVVGYWEKPSEEEEAEGGRKEERQLSVLSFKFSSSRKGKKIFEFSFQMCRWVFLNLEQLVVMSMAQQGWALGCALQKVFCKQSVHPFIIP